MLSDAVIIILREVLEAALIISVFMALIRRLDRSHWWLTAALIAGQASAVFYASNIRYISAAMGGVGQEVLNATLHILAYLCLLLFSAAAIRSRRDHRQPLIMASIITAVVIITAWEGTEIILYISGFAGIPELLNPVLLGSAVGAGIGVSVGIFFYYLLVNIQLRYGIWLGYLIVTLVAGSMILRAIQFLIQADLITVVAPVWDTSAWISERSIAGQLLYALVGYEATPAPIQVVTYFGSIGLLLLLSAFSFHRRNREAEFQNDGTGRA